MTRLPRPEPLIWAPLLTGLGLMGIVVANRLIPDHTYLVMFVSAVVMAIGATAWRAEIREIERGN